MSGGRGWPLGLWLALCLALAAAPFWLFAYNSGYGYDPLEYLLIGRLWAEGTPFYSYIPSKSFGIYALVALLWRLGVTFDHGSLAGVITATWALSAAATYAAFAPRLGSAVGLASALGVAASAAFMELNFFQPEAFAYVFGLLAYAGACRAAAGAGRSNLVLAGAALGLGFAFKSVAAFYVLGIGAFALWLARRRRAAGLPLYWAFWLGAGFALSAAPPALVFLATGRFAEFWTWSVRFPLFEYPAHLGFGVKLLSKLLWFHALVAAGLALSLRRPLRRALYADPPALLALCMGGASLLALLKTQATHYVFPAAGFLLAFAFRAFELALRSRPGGRARPPAWGAALLLGLLALSVLLYKPAALRRLVSLADYGHEDGVAELVDRYAPAGGRAFFHRDAMLFYWLARRAPVVRFVNSNVQTTWYLGRDPAGWLCVLGDPRVQLVEFDPESRSYDDPLFLDRAANRALAEAFARGLAQHFQRVDAPAGWPPALWVRRPDAAVGTGARCPV